MSAETPVSRRLSSVKHIILVLSGKGGVGKSSVSTQLALSLYAQPDSPRVGILDVDLTGPSIPRMLGVDEGFPVHQSSDGWVPIYVDGPTAKLSCMSVGFLVKKKEDSVVWRGPKKNAMIRQFLSDVRWGELDYLVVDTPPEYKYAQSDIVRKGTSDEHLSLMEHLAPLQSRLSSVIVTTPQAVALTDAMKGISFTRAVSLPILGLIENMSGYVCPCCGEVSNVFSRGGGEEMAKREIIHFLGRLPIDTQLVDLLDNPRAEIANAAARETISDDVAPVETPHLAFRLLDLYRLTPSFTLFRPITEEIARLVKSRPLDGTP
ncbi:cytosolic Fe-S cluster assembly factor cfd1 [Tulasnella sp. 331]|nr:cytosolic Fe-S cluster assembly factor cfd1 [Tulasnella sp. 331]KAG8888841.1 cytosolic Fe-S cluster assembly factor cfd1 [Tulasnella sp. 332]